jgi:hypothetical protein
MYKKVELLSKSNHKGLALDVLKDLDFAQDIKLVTLGLSEVEKLSSILPILISGGDTQQFVAFSGLSNQKSYFTTNRCQDMYIPMLLRGYPFLMVDSVQEGSEDRKFRAVAIDVESELVGGDKTHKIFEQDNVLSAFAQRKVQLVQNLDKDKSNAKRLINELQKYNLLDKRSYEIKVEDGTVKNLLSEFFVVNKERLFELDDEIILKWAKNDWLYTLEAHIKSIENINTLLNQLIKK